MSEVGDREHKAQERVVKVFVEELGYSYLGNWSDLDDNADVEVDLLRDWLAARGVAPALIDKSLRSLTATRTFSGGKNLYTVNRETYGLLRYGVNVSPGHGQQKVNVPLIDWSDPAANDFAIAEEVAIEGHFDKRPDIVLYVNGIALGVIELKRSTVSVAEGIRQNLDNQKKEFIRTFFSTVQLLIAGNDSEGVRYGTVGTPERHWATWRDETAIENPLDRGLHQLCAPDRLLEIVHDFIVFDKGIKKICRHNQYFAVKAASRRIPGGNGGIIWHTQGSGKSLTMVWLAKWIRETQKDARVVIVTDRTELDEQIEGVFLGVKEKIYRATSGGDLVAKLNEKTPWLLCSLVHKFGGREDVAVDNYIKELERQLPEHFSAKGNVFVFVDECHRTQSGKLHDAMQKLLPEATFIGFTGTPLLRKDKRTSLETWGSYIHTYKFDEAVRDRVILDLRYEARDIDQRLTSPDKIDIWFESHTASLTESAREQLKQRWGTLRKVLSSQSRLERIVADILFDMETKDRLMSGRGNALLVCGGIYQACKTYELLSQTHLRGKCAIVTSYRPSPADIKSEETGEGLTERIRKYETYRKMLSEHFGESEDLAMRRVEEFETQVKHSFVHDPGQMRLLIVVDKLLTGFDAPPATYLYVDKQMSDHGLFQAVCRVNRLAEVDKEYGYIVDYKDLFNSLKNAFADYTGAAFEGFDAADVEGLLADRLEKAREQLVDQLETVRALCEHVAHPRSALDYMRFFGAGDIESGQSLRDAEPRRLAFYKAVASLIRAYAAIAPEMEDAGFSTAEAASIKAEVSHFESVRQEVKLAAGDYIDLKIYEPAMRHLLDAYIQADESQTVAAFDEEGLVDLLVEKGLGALDSLPEGIRSSDEAVSETIENNLRKVIVEEQRVNPKYYETMSELLDALIKERKHAALEYRAYLTKLTELAKQVREPTSTNRYPHGLESPGKRALYDNLDEDDEVALALDQVIHATRREGWRGSTMKERELRNAITAALGGEAELAGHILDIAREHDEY
jgi:type I restriction enzyme, R subunit